MNGCTPCRIGPTDQDRNRIVAKLATRVPVPTRQERAQADQHVMTAADAA
jgi:hypothetical protein